MVNMVCDLIDPNDPEKRTHREINNSTEHKYKLGQLVELPNGSRLFINTRTRDCDGTPLYHLSILDESMAPDLYGYCEESIKPLEDIQIVGSENRVVNYKGDCIFLEYICGEGMEISKDNFDEMIKNYLSANF